jgi:3-hydroxyacyl-[acyl-carrier-protein] dehydratase
MKDRYRILELLPHRYPFLLVDKIIEDSENRFIAIKNVSNNEPFFQGHFPDMPVMPGVLIIEALAQAGGLRLLSRYDIKTKDNVTFFAGIEKARFRKPVLPGDTLSLEVKILSYRRGIAKIEGVAKVDGVIVAEATILTVIKPKKDLGL